MHAAEGVPRMRVMSLVGRLLGGDARELAVAIGSFAAITVFLRQRGSPESKPWELRTTRLESTVSPESVGASTARLDRGAELVLAHLRAAADVEPRRHPRGDERV